LEQVHDLYAQAREENQRGQWMRAEIAGLTGHQAIYQIARATRRFNSAQILASQASHMVTPPARLPVNLEK
jgi:hypothetical protein